MKRTILTSTGIAALAALGAVVALTLAPTAGAYTLPDLPGLGYTLNAVNDASQPGNCTNYYADGNGAPSTLLGSQDPACTDQAVLQQRIDALVAAYPPPPPPPSTTTAPTTATTTDPGTTTTTPGGGGGQPPPALPAAPVADFTGSTTNPNVIAFLDATTQGGGQIVSRLWLFGDGSTGSGQAPTHAYQGPGVYEVALIVADANGLGSLAAHELQIAADHTITLGPRQTQIATPTAAATTKKAATKPATVKAKTAVTINYKLSSCAPLPTSDEGKVRFFVQLSNTGGPAAFGQTIHFVWQRSDGSWKDSFLNTIGSGSLKVPGHQGKRYYADFGADPSKPIIACGFRIGSSPTVHRIRVLR